MLLTEGVLTNCKVNKCEQQHAWTLIAITFLPGLQYLLMNIGWWVGWFCMFEVWNKVVILNLYETAILYFCKVQCVVITKELENSNKLLCFDLSMDVGLKHGCWKDNTYHRNRDILIVYHHRHVIGPISVHELVVEMITLELDVHVRPERWVLHLQCCGMLP